MRVIVCDAGPIIHLYEAGCLSLLVQTGNLFLPLRVYSEVQAAPHINDQWPPSGFRWLNSPTKNKKEAMLWQTAGGLHAGEAEALVLAREKRADWFLTDDSATRLFVSLLGMEVHGSLGVILCAARRHLNRKEVEDALSRLEKSSLWLSAKIYQEARLALDDIYSKDQSGDA